MNKKILFEYLVRKKKSSGFTLIELLTVIIIVGILSAIALPSLLGQASKAKQTEAKTNVSAINRAQQAYRLENSSFATSMDQLAIGLATETDNYTYTIVADGVAARINAAAKDGQALKSYAGGLVMVGNGASRSIACQTLTASTTPPTITLEPTAEPACATGEKMK